MSIEGGGLGGVFLLALLEYKASLECTFIFRVVSIKYGKLGISETLDSFYLEHPPESCQEWRPQGLVVPFFGCHFGPPLYEQVH